MDIFGAREDGEEYWKADATIQLGQVPR